MRNEASDRLMRVLAVTLPAVLLAGVVVLIVLAIVAPRTAPGGMSGNDDGNGGDDGDNSEIGENGAFPRTVVNGDQTIVVPTRPVRIVSCTMASDEMLLDLVGLDRLAAITNMSCTRYDSMIRERVADFPVDRRVIQVREWAERILSWRPDLVVVANWTEPAFCDQLRQAQIPVLVLPSPDNVDAVMRTVMLLAEATGTDARGRRMVADMRRRMAPVVGAVYLDCSGDGRLSTSAGGTMMDDVMARAGYENRLRTDLNLNGWPAITFDQLLELDRAGRLDALIMPEYPRDSGLADPLESFLAAVPGAKDLSVMRADPPRVVRIPAALTSTVSQHVVRAIEHLRSQR
ncbi:MAG: ABC transporter substrate-binding protein [Planctomycetota bacterium]